MSSTPTQRTNEKQFNSISRVRTAILPPHVTSEAEVEEFLAWCAENGRAKNTITAYRLSLRHFLEWLPEGKEINNDTVALWRKALLGRSIASPTAEFNVSAANSLLEYCGRRDLQAPLLKQETSAQPELTREEYLRMLSTAKSLGRERTCFLIKTFGTTGLNIAELKELTVEAVLSGYVKPSHGERVYIPKSFQQELLEYGERNGIQSGPLIVNSGGRLPERSVVWRQIAAVGRDARVDESKCNPRCLRRLCLRTKSDIRRSLELMEARLYDLLLDDEQRAVGWD